MDKSEKSYHKLLVWQKLHFMEIAETSLLELEAQSEVCLILGYWDKEAYDEFDKQRSEAGYFLHRYKLKLSP